MRRLATILVIGLAVGAHLAPAFACGVVACGEAGRMPCCPVAAAPHAQLSGPCCAAGAAGEVDASPALTRLAPAAHGVAAVTAHVVAVPVWHGPAGAPALAAFDHEGPPLFLMNSSLLR